jgi:hypothetical protein
MNPIVFVLLAAVLVGVAFYLAALPLIQQARRSAPAETASSEQERLDELLAQRTAAFQAIRELNFDHRLGKITDEDFAAFEAGLKHNAAESLRALDRWETDADAELDAWIDREVRLRKAALASAPLVELDGRACRQCGRPAATGDKFCGSCGAALIDAPVTPVKPSGGERFCPQCGMTHLPDDRFCARCGQSLVPEVAPAAG